MLPHSRGLESPSPAPSSSPVQDTTLSRWVHGFESHRGHLIALHGVAGRFFIRPNVAAHKSFRHILQLGSTSVRSVLRRILRRLCAVFCAAFKSLVEVAVADH